MLFDYIHIHDLQVESTLLLHLPHDPVNPVQLLISHSFKLIWTSYTWLVKRLDVCTYSISQWRSRAHSEQYIHICISIYVMPLQHVYLASGACWALLLFGSNLHRASGSRKLNEQSWYLEEHIIVQILYSQEPHGNLSDRCQIHSKYLPLVVFAC